LMVFMMFQLPILLDARQSYVEIAKVLKVSNSLVHQRIAKMKDRLIVLVQSLWERHKLLYP